MKSFNGRPIIEEQDHPQVVDRALHESIGYWHEHMPPDQANAWVKTAADAWGAVQDGFGLVGDEMLEPEGEATLYVSPDQLELALVAYGCNLLDQNHVSNSEIGEIVAINGLLRGIDQIKAENS